MLTIFKKDDSLSPQKNLKRIEEKLQTGIDYFSTRLKVLEDYAESFQQKINSRDKQINRFKQFCHNIDTLISDKDQDLKLIFANEPLCTKIYGLEKHCTDLISGRYEYEVINDYIEKTNKWNTFVECYSFNIDNIVKEQLQPKQFIQIGLIDNTRIILKSNLKPYFENDEFKGIMTVSKIISSNDFERSLAMGGKLLYEKNKYIVYEI